MSASTRPEIDPAIFGDIDQDILPAWYEFFETRSIESRNTIITRFMPFIWKLAWSFKTRIQRGVEVGDLAAFGVLGMIDALESFDPYNGLYFRNWARRRIVGAMIDGIRQLDPLPVRLIEKDKAVRGAVAPLEQDLGREPTRKELAAEMGVTVERLETILVYLDRMNVAYLGSVRADSESGELTIGDSLAYDAAIGEAQEHEETIREIWAVVATLSPRKQRAMDLYYRQGMTPAEVGDELGCGKRNVFYLIRESLKRCRAELQGLKVA